MNRSFQCLLIIFAVGAINGCSNSAGIKTESTPKYANNHSFRHKPAELRVAARKVLQDLITVSMPASTASVAGDDSSETILANDWVYDTSKDKFVTFIHNGEPQRKRMIVRRKIRIQVMPSLAGSEVSLSIEEEVEKIDGKTGQGRGWNSTSADRSFYDQLIRSLQEAINQR